jgi:Tfp pilus assembly protein PilZ
MEGKSSIIQGLPFITIILALLLFIIFRVVSRFKKRALGDTGSKKLPNFQVEVKAKEDQPERIQLKCPALIDKSKGVMKVGIKELTTNGAFVTCPHPFSIGETFSLKILLNDHDSQTFNAEVVWNNQNVLEEEVVTRGMKVRFLQLTESDRKIINEIIALGFPAESLS